MNLFEATRKENAAVLSETATRHEVTHGDSKPSVTHKRQQLNRLLARNTSSVGRPEGCIVDFGWYRCQ